jgi:serine/threonine-protein kinase
LKGKPADGRSDQFSWAVLAYELLEGKRPWEAHDALGIVATMMSEPPKPMQSDDIPEALRSIVMHALSSAPAARFGSMDDIIELLEPFAEGESKSEIGAIIKPVTAKQSGPTKRTGPITGSKYSTQELGQVIALALERKAQADAAGAKYEYDDMKSAALEVGIQEDELRAALASLRPALPPMTDKPSERRLRSQKRLERHAGIWGVVSAFFFLINLLTPGPFWFFFPMLTWGVVLGIHAVLFYFPVNLTPEEEEYHERLKQLQKEKHTRKLSAKQQRIEGAKLRIAASPVAASEDEDEALAEEEAAREKKAERKRRAR